MAGGEIVWGRGCGKGQEGGGKKGGGKKGGGKKGGGKKGGGRGWGKGGQGGWNLYFNEVSTKQLEH